jgi:hypothetical protein
MKSISRILEKILEQAKNNVPEYLGPLGLPDFDIYSIGYPTDQDEKAFSVYFSGRDYDETETFRFTINLQLPGVLEAESYKWTDAVEWYLSKGFFPSRCGFFRHKWTTVFFAAFRDATPEIYIDVAMYVQHDDCE